MFNESGVDDNYIITMRNPLASAFSNQKFVNIELEEAILLWMMILISAIDGTQNKKRVLVSYELMLDDPRLQIRRMQKSLSLSSTLDERNIDDYANNFLDNNLKHYSANANELKSHSVMAVAPLCLRIYDLLMQTAKDEIDLNSAEFQSAWRKIKLEFDMVYPAYHYLKSLFSKNRQLKKEIRSIQLSFPWKLVMPLRWVDNFLRSKRRGRKLITN